MNRVFFIALLFLCVEIKAQIIHGRVLESGTNKPVAGAHIYFEGTFQSAASDSAGNFSLRTNLSNNYPILVSSLGYSTATITSYSAKDSLKVYLKLKPVQLKTVQVGYDGMSMKEKINIFKKEFLGTSSYARGSDIENIDDVDFTYNRKLNILTASADKPIVVHNKELGYKLSYFLTSFRFLPGLTSLSGNEVFEEDVSSKETVAKIKEKREDAYLGSRMHFIRSLWNNELEKNNYKIYDVDYKRLNYDDLIVVKDNKKYIRLIRVLQVQYKNKPSLLLLQKEIFIDKNGFYSPGITWNEDMGNQRMGDLLPLEYAEGN